MRAGFAASAGELAQFADVGDGVEVASDYLRLRATQQQLFGGGAGKPSAIMLQRTLQLTQSRYQSGAGNELDVDQAQVLAQVDALLPTLFDRQNV